MPRRRVTAFRGFKVRFAEWLGTLSWSELEELREVLDAAVAPHEKRMNEARAQDLAGTLFAPFGKGKVLRRRRSS